MSNNKDNNQPVIIKMEAAVMDSVGVTYASPSVPGSENLTDCTNQTLTNSTGGEENEPLGLAIMISLSSVLGIIILTTVVGNVLVCLSPLVCHRLRTATYTFLVSLAIADLLLGVTVLPFSAVSTLTSEWYFGAVFCNIYTSCDVMFCTSSILHLLVISLDRYMAITRPYAYQRKMNRRKAYAALAVVWTISLLISFLPLHLGWNTDSGKVQNYEDPSQCTVETNTFYALFDGIVLFFVPLVLMTLVYIRLVRIANRQARAIQRLMISSNSENAEERANRRRSVDEHRALKIIAIVMGCFVICWVPYFSIFTFAPLLDWNIHPILYQVVLWLGYLNSLVNPLVYAAMNREFRRAFKRLLTCMRWNPPDDSYDSRYYTTTQYSTNRTTDRSRSGSKNGAVRYSATNHQSSGNGSNKHTLQLPLKTNGIYMKLFRSSSSSTRPQAT